MLTSAKKNCFIIFAFPHVHNWENDIINKFSLIYEVKYIYADHCFNKGGTEYLIKVSNEIIINEKIDVIVFDTDFAPYIDANVIKSFSKSIFKILLTFDNIVHSNLNLINASYCNLVLTADPIDVLKLKEYNLNSMYFQLEGSSKVYKDLSLIKDFDILFYGQLHKFGRKEFISALIERGYNIKIVGPPDNIVTNEKLVELINRSKIVLNFSYSDSTNIYKNFFPLKDNDINAPMLQFKGRFLQCGLCSTLCISEYAPSIELLFNNDEVPTFKNIEECEYQIIKYLNDNSLRESIVTNLKNKCIKLYEDFPIMRSINLQIENNTNFKTLNFNYNKYYKSYITRFKIINTINKPFLLIGELKYLYKYNLLLINKDILMFILINILSRLKSKIQQSN
jgi:hypothetical protein